MTPLGLAKKITKYIQAKGYVIRLRDLTKRREVLIDVYPNRESLTKDRAQLGVIGQKIPYRIGIVSIAIAESYWTSKKATIVPDGTGAELAIDVREEEEFQGELSDLMRPILRQEI